MTCFVTQMAIMLIDDAELGVFRRLCWDIVAAVTGDWNNEPRSARPREISFTWPDRSQEECWRAFTAFAEKQMAEPDVRVVLCGEALVERLPELTVGRELLAVPDFAELGLADKRALWRRMQALSI